MGQVSHVPPCGPTGGPSFPPLRASPTHRAAVEYVVRKPCSTACVGLRLAFQASV